MSDRNIALSSFIEAAPPGELSNVIADIKAIAGDNVLTSLGPAFKEYNEHQFTTVKLPGSSQSVIVSRFNSLDGNRYFDVDSATAFDFDHTTQKASGASSHALESSNADLVKSILKSLSTHANEHYPLASIGVYPINADSAIAVVIVANRYSPNNFWNGRWRSHYVYDPASGKLSGTINVDTHFFEDGNIRLACSKDAECNAAEGEVVKQIALVERRYQEELNKGFTQLSEQAFKGLRRQLPVTRQKMEWEKIASYRVGADIGGGRQK